MVEWRGINVNDERALLEALDWFDFLCFENCRIFSDKFLVLMNALQVDTKIKKWIACSARIAMNETYDRWRKRTPKSIRETRMNLEKIRDYTTVWLWAISE